MDSDLFIYIFKELFVLLVPRNTIDYLSLAALSLRCWARPFSSSGEWGLLPSHDAWASPSSGFSCCGAPALGHQASVVWHAGSRAWV